MFPIPTATDPEITASDVQAGWESWHAQHTAALRATKASENGELADLGALAAQDARERGLSWWQPEPYADESDRWPTDRWHVVSVSDQETHKVVVADDGAFASLEEAQAFRG